MAARSKEPSRRKLLSLWSRQVRDRDGNKCSVCQSSSYIQAHHLIPKERFPLVQYELSNGLSLCARCHKFGAWSFHRNPIWSVVWLQKFRPDTFRWVVEKLKE